MACVLSACALAAHAQPQKDVPRVLLAVPLGVAPGVPTRVTLRGLKLDAATAVRVADGKTTARVLSKGRATVPAKQEPAKVGDTQVVVEVTLPAGTPAGTVPVVVLTPTGPSPPHRMLVEDRALTIVEKEPNDGFRDAQPVRLPCVVDGLIERPTDVDVYRFDGQAGQRVALEVLAARYGSALDSVLTLYDDQGRELAGNDDAGASTDAALEYTLPRTGRYYVSVIDAHDQGGPAHPYRLRCRVARPESSKGVGGT